MLDGNESTERSVAESIAESISQGEQIEWERVERQGADEHETGVLHELHLVDRIAAFHRRPESSRPTDPSSMVQGVAKPDDNILTWAHLRIIEKIGEGVFGTVYRARDAKLQSDVALKLMWPDGPGTPSSPTRALKEARLLARIRHANVVQVYGADRIDGRVGLWMEFIKGRTLANVLSTHGPFSAREAALIGLDLCRALAAVHRARLIHGDIKAHNVMREEGGRTVLMDFGTGKDLARPFRGRRLRRHTALLAARSLRWPAAIKDDRHLQPWRSAVSPGHRRLSRRRSNARRDQTRARNKATPTSPRHQAGSARGIRPCCGTGARCRPA